MITGETDPSHLAELGSPRLGCSRDTLVEALDGRVREHHRFLLDQHLKTIEQMEETVAVFDARIEAALAPFRDTVERLRQVPGLSTTAAEVVIAEIGLDMSRFPTAGHLLSRAGLVPGLDESAGKRRSTRVTKGAPWLKPVLVQCAWAAARKRGSCFEAQFLRLKGRRGPKKGPASSRLSPCPSGAPPAGRGGRSRPPPRSCPPPTTSPATPPATPPSAPPTSPAAIRPAPLASSQIASGASATSSKSGAPH